MRDRALPRNAMRASRPWGGEPPRTAGAFVWDSTDPNTSKFHNLKKFTTPLVTAPMDARPSSALWNTEQGQRPTMKPCARCQAQPRVTGQRWCRPCLTEYARARRQRQRATVKAVTQVLTHAKGPVTPVRRLLDAVTGPSLLVCGAEAPEGFPPGCGLPFTPRVPWRPYYCCNGCGLRQASHTEECPVEGVPVEAARD